MHAWLHLPITAICKDLAAQSMVDISKSHDMPSCKAAGVSTKVDVVSNFGHKDDRSQLRSPVVCL